MGSVNVTTQQTMPLPWLTPQVGLLSLGDRLLGWGATGGTKDQHWRPS